MRRPSKKMKAGVLATATLFARASFATPVPKPIRPDKAPTAAEISELQDLEKDAQRYSEVAKEHNDLLLGVIKKAYKDKVDALEKKFDKAITAEEAELARRRKTAIEKFEAFLAEYPTDKRWSPDVMFRLAELYFDRSKLDLNAAQIAYEQLLKGHENDEQLPIDPATGKPVTSPRPDYTLSINLYRDIIRNFADYRLIDGVHYLLAYLYGEEGKPSESKQAYLGLACAKREGGAPGYNALDVPSDIAADQAAADLPEESEAKRRTSAQPKPVDVPFVDPYKTCLPLVKAPKLVEEAWVRIGEQHFDNNELKLAIAAYSMVVDDKKGDFYSEALYKLAWSYYRDAVGVDAAVQFQKSIDRFDELVTWSDEQEKAGKGRSPLRKESIEYLAISFAENWEQAGQPDAGKGLVRIKDYYKDRMKERHVRDVYEQLGDIYAATSQWDAAVTAYRTALDKWPTDRANPGVSRKVISSLEKKGDQQSSELAFQERAQLSTIYHEGNPKDPYDPKDKASDWWIANILDRAALDDARALTEGSIIESAKHFHELAQIRRKQWKLDPKNKALEDEYKRLYNEAARLYNVYIEKYPNSRDTYEVSFFLAEALYWSGQYDKAAPKYAWVRDSSLGSTYHKDAALSYVKSWEEAYRAALADPQSGVKELDLPCKELPKEKGAKPCNVVTLPVTPIPLADVEKNLRDAYDQYQKSLKGDESSASMLEAAALISFKHIELDDALVRFRRVYDEYCSTPQALQASEGILAIYQIQGKLDDIQAWLEKMLKDKCGGGADPGKVGSILTAVRFEKAKKLAAEGKFEEAAKLYVILYEESKRSDPKNPDDDALWNAALSYENMGRPKKATVIYDQLVNEVPQSKHVGDALFRMALSYKAAFDYSKAVANFLLLAENNRFKDYEHRNDALFNAAQLLEQDQNYSRSADLFMRFAAAVKVKLPDDSANAYYHAAEVYEKAQQWDQMVKTLRNFEKDYATGKNAGENIVYAHYKIAKAFDKQNRHSEALKEYKTAAAAFWDHSLPTASAVANVAAESAFQLAEEQFVIYKAKKFKWTNATNEKKVNADLDKLAADGKAIIKYYQDIDRYVTPWLLATDVRLADISFEGGEKLFNTPIPPEIVKLDKQNPDLGVVGQYQDALENQYVKPFRESAKKLWEKAVKDGESKGISNEWTDRARKSLHDLDPDNWPTQKPAKTEIWVNEVR